MGCLQSREQKTSSNSQTTTTTQDPPKVETNSSPTVNNNKEVSINDKYTIGQVLGKGAFSVVKKVTEKSTGDTYALKCINKKSLPEEELSLLDREIKIMQKLDHAHIIGLHEKIDTPNTLYLVLEFVPGGELFDAIVDKGAYSEEETAELVRQMLEAIAYCHSQNIAHRDLKPENLLLKTKEPPFLKIADFGLSKDFGEASMATACGTPDYVAPEVINPPEEDTGYGSSVDIWSIGVITYVLLCGFTPFDEEDQRALFEKIMNAKYEFPSPSWDEVSEEAKDFIRKILIVDPNKRPTAKECLQDPWITQFASKKDNKSSALKRNKSFAVKKFQEKQEKYKNEKKQKATGGGLTSEEE